LPLSVGSHGHGGRGLGFLLRCPHTLRTERNRSRNRRFTQGGSMKGRITGGLTALALLAGCVQQ
jgi:hypothetical protein